MEDFDLDIDYYSKSGCHYCTESNYIFKKAGVFGDLNVKKDAKLLLEQY